MACAYAPCAGAGRAQQWLAERVPLPARLGKAGGRNPSKNAAEQSDRFILPEKPLNKGSSILVESGPWTGGDGGGKGPDQGEPG